MYNLIISVSIGLIVGVAVYFLPWSGSLWLSIPIGSLSILISFVLLSRRIMKKLEPAFVQAQKQAQARQFKLGIKTLESLLPMCKWQIMLKGQIYSQLGIFYYADKNENMAIECLKKGSSRTADAQLILATIHFRKKEYDQCKNILDLTIKVNKKQVLLYNAYAFMLNQMKQTEEGIQVLQKALKVNDDNDATKDNLLRLQNGKKMNMKPFGMNWYNLQLEKPPMSMMQDQFSGRAGFRQKRVKGR